MLDLLKFTAGQHLGQAILELLDQFIADRVAEGEAELLRAQHPEYLELGGIQLLGGNEIHQCGLVGGDQVDPAGGEHLERLGQAVGGHDFLLVKAVVEQQLLPHIGAHRPYGVLLGIFKLGEGERVLGQPYQHDFGIPDGACPFEQRIPRLGTGGGEQHHIGFLGQQVIAASPGHDGDGLRRRIGLFPHLMQQLDGETGRVAGAVCVVIGFVLFAEVVQLAKFLAGLGDGCKQQRGKSNPFFHAGHPDEVLCHPQVLPHSDNSPIKPGVKSRAQAGSLLHRLKGLAGIFAAVPDIPAMPVPGSWRAGTV